MSSTKEAEKADAPRKSKSTKTNGGYQNNGNLEDCYTNVFALTEVNGLKWKCYRTPSNAPRGVPLTSDPILKAYSKCVQDGILCAWRRKQLNMSNNNDPLPIPSFSHDMQKELWIFWYNDEPALLEDVCTDLEIDEEASTAASSNTVSYEVRIILFKALHVVMERSLMKNGFVRFGRWFTKPLKAVNKIAHYYMIPTYSIAVRFSFFVHGGNTICAVINAQRQPTLIQLHKRHLEHKNTIKRFAVIVGPWSMRGTLVQNQLELLSEPKMQTNAEREWNEWKEFVQLEVNEDNEERKKKNEETKEKNSEEGASNEEKVQEEKNDEEKEKSKNVKIEAAEKIEEIIQLKMEERIDEVEPPTAENPQNIEVENKKDKAEKREKHGDDSDSSYDDSDIDDDTSSEAAAEKAKFEHLIPKMVLVEIDGVRMLYPSKYVCVTLEDDRNCLEALGHRISMIPDEIMIQGRRPRNKFVVQASMSQFPLLGVMQYISGPKNKLMPKPPLSGGFAQPFPPIDERVLRWKFYENYELQCDCFTTGKNRCLSCAFIEKRIKAKVGLTLSKKENVIPMKRILNQMAQKPDISAYHRTQNIKTAQIIKLKERLRTMSESTTAPSTSAVVKTSKKEEEDEGGGIFRPDCDDESWHLDDDHIPDWMNTEKNILPTTVLCNPEELSSYQAAMVSSPNRSSDDESTSAPPSPFTPYTIVSPCSKECNWPASTLENMSEKVFNQIFQANSKKPKLLPTASREEKYKEYDSYYNPTLVFDPVHTPEFASYHRKRKWKKKPKKIIETDVPFSKYSSFFKGEMCEHGAFGYKTWKSEVEQAKKAAEEATTSKSPERQKLTEKQKKMNEIIEMAEKSAKEKSVLASVRKLVRIKDHPANNYHRWKKNRKHFEKITESDLDDFDINSFGKKNAEDFTSRTEHIVGYMSPDFEKSPNYRYHDEDDEENEDENVRHLTDEMKGLGEGTSNQFANGESMEIDTENENNLVESASASEHQEGEQRKDGEEEKNKQTGENINGNDIQITDLHNNSDEHGPTDGLLSPPASNEMPKSGPLSVGADAIFPRGPPSIEGQAMNQIYPTPPSVQMMFNDQQQLHSPVMMNYGKGVRTTMTPITEIVERVDVVGGTGTINEISSDEEAENLVNWKEKLKDDKFNKLLVKTKHAPLISNKRKTHLPLSEKFGVNEGNNKKSERLKKRNGVYPKMIDNAFENPPFDSFGKLLLPIHQPIIHNNFHGMANQPIPPIGFNGMPGPIGHHPSMMPQYQPPHGHLVMNQMNVFPPHPPPNNMPNQFVGPPHHHPMNIPPGPHGFGANGPMGPGGFGPHPNPNQFHMMPNIGPMGHPNRGMPMPPMYPPHRHQIVPSMLSAPGNRPPLGAPPAYGVPSMPPPPPSSSSISQQQQQQQQQQHQQQQQQQQLQQQLQQQQQQPQLPPQPQGSQPMYQPVQQLNNFVNQARFGGNMMGSPGYGPPPPGFDNHAMIRQQQQQQQQQHMFGQQPNMMGMANPMMSQQQQQQHHMMMRQQQQQQQHQMQQSLGHPSNYPQPMTNQMPTISNTMMPFRSRDIPQIPEGESIVIAIILSDTILDLHFDTAMDSCPICACTVSIRARELGLYITPHEVLRSGNQMTRDHNIGPWSGFHLNAGTMCNCGFSAIRHRYLSLCAGLFPEDSNEATALENSVASVAPPLDLNHLGMEVSKNINWFDSSSPNDLAILDQIRQSAYSHSYGKAVTQMAALSEHTDKTSKAMDIGMDVSSSSEYVLSHVDSMELLMLGNSAIDMCMRSMSMSRAQPTSSKQFLTYFHPWGLQTANEIRDPNTNEWKAILGAVTPSLENSIRLARSITSQGAVNIVEGPLTWRKFVQKGLKNRPNAQGVEDETASIPEPVPAVTVATSNEILRAAPNIRSIWHQAQLAPVDQPKDVMYMTIIPDDDVAYTKTVKFMDIVTRNYEKMRLGKHIPFPVSSGAVNAKNRNHFANMRRTAVGTPMQHNFGIDPTEGGVQEGSIEKSKEAQKSIGAPSTRDKFQFTSTPNNADLDKPMATPMTWNDMKRVGGEKANNTQTVEVSEREGILRVGGTRQLPAKFRAHSAATSPEFLNLTKHLNDRTGFVTRLKMYAQQMEELVDAALQDNTTAFERYGFRYQVAIENRLKREKDAANMAAVKEKAAATVSENVEQSEENASATDSAGNVQSSAETGENPSSSGQQLTSGNERGSGNVSMAPPASLPPPPPPPPIINQIPSPIPAGMVHIPETLPENERNMQPTLTELLSEPSSLLPHGAASIQWVQRDTTVPNPFPTSNQPPVDYEEVGGKEKDDAATLPHVIVIYITNPFTWGTEQHTAMHMRIALLTFIRTFNSIVAKLPPKKRPQLQLEIIGMEQMEDSFQSIPDYLNDPKIPMDLYAKSANSNFVKMDEGEKIYGNILQETARSLAVAVYSHPRVFFPDVYKLVQPRCMTAFGPGSQLLKTVDELERLNKEYFASVSMRASMGMRGMMNYHHPHQHHHHHHPMMSIPPKGCIAYKVPSNLWCLAPPPSIYQMEQDGKVAMTPMDEQVLFVSYCLVGSDYLVAAATDTQGRLVDSCVINMKPKHEAHQLYRFKQRTQILDTMGRLWTFILGVMASDIKNWRLVVGRLGRIGHGEFRAWTHLLNKTSLLKYSTRLKDICAACNQMPGSIGTPAVLSACLVTIEPEPNLRLFPDYFDTDFLSKKGRQLQTPDDVSCTHIITFPVGAEINYETQDQSTDTKAEENWDFGDLDIMEGLDEGDSELLKDVGLTETPQSAALRPGGYQSFFMDETANIDIQNQPLAAGYYVSTSPAPELPDWFWASCPSAKRSIPVHLKSSLHIHISEVKNDDIAIESTSSAKEKEKEKEKELHPLESHQTEEVLRHVLESYNALSWLNIDPTTGDRYSCMPIHIQHLLRLYHSIVRLIM